METRKLWTKIKLRRVERSRWSLICWNFSPNWQFMLTLIAQCSPPNVSCYSCVYLFFTAYICILPGKVFLPKKQFFVFLKWSFLFKKSFQPARFRNVVWIFFKACLRLEFLKHIKYNYYFLGSGLDCCWPSWNYYQMRRNWIEKTSKMKRTWAAC